MSADDAAADGAPDDFPSGTTTRWSVDELVHRAEFELRHGSVEAAQTYALVAIARSLQRLADRANDQD